MEKEKIKKIAVISGMCLACAGCLWFIFSPDGKQEDITYPGLNTTVPDPQKDVIIGNKKNAYELENLNRFSDDRMNSLDEYAQILMGEKENKIPVAEPEKEETKVTDHIENSLSAYKDVNRSLETMLATPDPYDSEQDILELTWRVQNIEEKLEQSSGGGATKDDQLEILERSYELAARYMQQPQPDVEYTETVSTEKKEKYISAVNTVGNNPVSFLHASGLASTPVISYASGGFRSFSTYSGMQERNTIRACIHTDQTVMNGQLIRLRLQEPIEVGGVVIPVNHVVTGKVGVQGERLLIVINAIEYKGNIFPVNLSVSDTDGIKGLYIPGSEELDAMKEILANMGSTAGTSINITDNLGSQLAADLTKSLVQGTSKYFQKKIRAVKVHVKAGHQVYMQLND